MNLTKSLIRVSLVTGALLLVPFVAMQFTAEVNWTLSDFVFAGALLFGTGMTLELVASRRGPVAYRLAAAGAVLTALLQLWANLAVGFIGSGPNPANLLCGAVLVVGLGGALVARFQARGMAYAMLAMAGAQLLVPVLGLVGWQMQIMPQEWIFSAFFAALWAGAAWLFQRSGAAPQQMHQQFA